MNALVRFVVAAAVCLVSGAGFAQCLAPLGDVDSSGAVNVIDVQCSILVTLWTLQSENQPAPICANGTPFRADLDCSEEVSIVDVQILVQASLGVPLNPAIDADANGCPDSCEPEELECTSDECIPTVDFTAGWKETLSLPIVAGGKLKLRYDWERLPNCRGTKYGFPAWSIIVWYSFDLNSGAQYVPAWTKSDNYSMIPDEPIIDVPANATRVWLWAQNNNAFGCNQYDSDFGANYEFPVFSGETLSQPVGWAGDVNFVVSQAGALSLLGALNPVWSVSSLGASGIYTWIQFEVWVPGITDRAYQNADVRAEVARVALDARAVAPSLGPSPFPLEFVGVDGNNFVYRWDLAPVAQLAPPGQHTFDLEVSTALGAAPWELFAAPFTAILGEAKDCSLFSGSPPTTICP
jgi:hypothetical protein